MDTQVQLIYMSKAELIFNQEALQSLLEKSRTYNKAENITGILLFKRGYFLQVLEGSQARVDALYDVIRRDSRHSHIELLARRENIERHFPDWTMGFIDLEIQRVRGTTALFQTKESNSSVSQDQELVQKLIQSFQSNNWKQQIL